MDIKLQILLLTVLFFSSFNANASEKNKEFIKAVICAYEGNHAEHCDEIKPLSKFSQCPKEEFVQQGAISYVVNTWSLLQGSNIQIQNIKKEELIQNIKSVALSLLVKGCDINKLDIGGKNALHSSILLSNRDAMIFLLENGADPYKKIDISRSSKYSGRDAGLNSFDLIKKQHKKDSLVNNTVYSDTKIYNYVQKQYPNELEPLKKKTVEIDLSKHTPTEFGKVLVKRTALDPKVLTFDVYANKQFPIEEQKSEALYFEWFEKQKATQQACSEYKVIDRYHRKTQEIDASDTL